MGGAVGWLEEPGTSSCNSRRPSASRSIFWTRGLAFRTAMIVYDGGKFHPRFMVQLRGSVMPFSFAVALPCALLAAGLKYSTQHWEEQEVWESVGIDASSNEVVGSAFTGMNFLIGFLIVFRAQQAYSRFWEGCTAISNMQAEWFDATSSLIAFCKSSMASKRDVTLFQHTMIRLMSLLNACVLVELSTGFENQSSGIALPSKKRALELELIDAEGIDSQSLLSINSTSNKVQLLFTWLQQLVVENNTKNLFTVQPPILARCFQELSAGMVHYHKASMIANIPMPFPYVQATEMLLVSHWLLIPFLMCLWVASPLWTGILTFFQVAFFWSLNSIATELENPFGEDANDLPVQEMQRGFNQQLVLLLRPSTGYTAHLSHKAALAETQEFDDAVGARMTLGKTITVGKRGVNHTLPRHLQTSSLEVSRITLADLQDRIDTLEENSSFVTPASSGVFSPGNSLSSPHGATAQQGTVLKANSMSSLPDPIHECSASTLGSGSDGRRQRRCGTGDGIGESVSPSTLGAGAKGWQEPDPIRGSSANRLGASSVAPSLPAAACVQQERSQEPLSPGSFLRQQPLPRGTNRRPPTVVAGGTAVGELPASAAPPPLEPLVALWEELREQLRALQPELVHTQLACLPELLHLARECLGPTRTAFGPFGSAGPFSERGAVVAAAADSDVHPQYVALHHAVGRPLGAGCANLRSCMSQESQWSAKLMR
mmetsp:Transcript_46649/g.129797  ORF Transcript_46649/g.129797 Transcript_46649/m.129797 type:complete len:716 (-) Transcript_46649:63-2210(-)